MLSNLMLVAIAQGQESPISAHSILVNLPHDPAAFVVYALTAAAVWAVVHYGVKSSKGGPKTPDAGGDGRG